jgi:molybdenum cofactor guanylyltransferase
LPVLNRKMLPPFHAFRLNDLPAIRDISEDKSRRSDYNRKELSGCYYLPMQAAGFVLVGGKSARMGQDKALLLWRSQRLVEIIAARVASVTGTVTLVGRPERYLNVNIPCLSDHRHELGPLAGIEAALETGQGEWNLIVGCDMPDISADALRSVLDQAGQTKALCVAAQDTTGRIQPLCAAYHRRSLPIIRRSLEEGRLKLMNVLEDLQTEYVLVQTKLVNINTPEDWLHWQQLSAGRT